MNTSKLYAEATGKVEPEVGEEANPEKEISKEILRRWINDPLTKQLLAYLESQEQQYLLQARGNANSDNLSAITKPLIQSKTIREVIDYVRRN